jgi:parvulin-like peptidyl-prolyl isomerase
MLGPIERGTLCTELEEEAFRLELLELSEVIRSKLGVHIMRVVSREAARDLRFEEVAHAIVSHLGSRRRAETADALTEILRRSAVIELF